MLLVMAMIMLTSFPPFTGPYPHHSGGACKYLVNSFRDIIYWPSIDIWGHSLVVRIIKLIRIIIVINCGDLRLAPPHSILANHELISPVASFLINKDPQIWEFQAKVCSFLHVIPFILRQVKQKKLCLWLISKSTTFTRMQNLALAVHLHTCHNRRSTLNRKVWQAHSCFYPSLLSLPSLLSSPHSTKPLTLGEAWGSCKVRLFHPSLMPWAANIVRQWDIWLGAVGLEVGDLNSWYLQQSWLIMIIWNNVVKTFDKRGYFIPAGETIIQYSEISILIVDVNAH